MVLNNYKVLLIYLNLFLSVFIDCLEVIIEGTITKMIGVN